jgi:hypothetical protein
MGGFIKKQLGTVEDLDTGLGKTVQPRPSGQLTLTKVNVSELGGVYTVNTIAEFEAIDPTLLGAIKAVNVLEAKSTYELQPDGTWNKSSLGGQFSDVGTSEGHGIAYTVAKSAIEDIIIASGTNGFSANSFELVDGATLTIEDDASYTVI